MSERFDNESPTDINSGEDEDVLQRALIRLTSPQVNEIKNELSQIKKRVEFLEKLEDDNERIHEVIVDIRSSISDVERNLRQLSVELNEPAKIEERLATSIVPVLHGQVRDQGDDVAEALAPVIGPAIRHQIRDAKDDIINALYPLIGQIIGKAISEALRELTRNIDSRLRQQLNIRERFNRLASRLRGISEAELILRDSLPYSIKHIFLIHQETGILLEHLIIQGDNTGEMRSVSGMLTAIRDFVRDSFSSGEGELEEISHGDLRILLEGGQYAYIAVVLTGIEPVGYNDRINEVVHTINFQFEKKLKEFDGDMENLPEFIPILRRLTSVESETSPTAATRKPLTQLQKRAIGFSLVGTILLFVLIFFSCIFTIRLWPLAFPPTLPPSPSLIMPSSTPVPSATLTMVSTNTQTPFPTLTLTLSPSVTPTPLVGILNGNLNVRAEPSSGSVSYGVVMSSEKVIIKDRQGDWFLIAWPAQGEPSLSGWIMGIQYLELPEGYLP